MSDYREFLRRNLKGLKWRSGGEGSAKCPFHDDRKASFSVNAQSGLWFCHACNVGGTARDFAARRNIEAPAGNRLTAECAFDYRDESGALLYQVVRFAGKNFKQRRPDGKGGWHWNLDGVRRVPYRLPELLKARGNVFIVEGEKDVETLRAQELTATCNSGGAGKWRDEYGEGLKGRVCILIADNDEAGLAHIEDVARKLAPYAEKVINLGVLLGSPEHGDVSDWFAASHTAAELLALVGAAEQNACAPRAASAAQSDWPEPLNGAALYGAAGEFVKLVEPHTEADPAAASPVSRGLRQPLRSSGVSLRRRRGASPERVCGYRRRYQPRAQGNLVGRSRALHGKSGWRVDAPQHHVRAVNRRRAHLARARSTGSGRAR
jgi:hypothetical protein